MSELSAGPGLGSGSNALVIWQPAVEAVASRDLPSDAPVVASAKRWPQVIRVAKLALMVWGGVSLTAAGAYAVGTVLSGPQQLTEATAPKQPVQTAALAPAGTEPLPAKLPEPAAAKAKPRLAKGQPDPVSDPGRSESLAAAKPQAEPAATVTPPARTADLLRRRAQPLTNADDIGVAGTGFTKRPELEVTGEVVQPAVGEEDAIASARVPRPRPDEPLVTGSIERQWDEVRRPRRWDRRMANWRDREFRRIQRLPRYIIVR